MKSKLQDCKTQRFKIKKFFHFQTFLIFTNFHHHGVNKFEEIIRETEFASVNYFVLLNCED